MLDRLVHAVVGHVVAGRLGTEDHVVAHVLLDKAVAIMTADHRVGQVHVFDLGLQLTAVLFGDLATEDDGDLVRLADGSGWRRADVRPICRARRGGERSGCRRIRTAGADSPLVGALFRSRTG